MKGSSSGSAKRERRHFSVLQRVAIAKEKKQTWP